MYMNNFWWVYPNESQETHAHHAMTQISRHPELALDWQTEDFSDNWQIRMIRLLRWLHWSNLFSRECHLETALLLANQNGYFHECYWEGKYKQEKTECYHCSIPCLQSGPSKNWLHFIGCSVGPVVQWPNSWLTKTSSIISIPCNKPLPFNDIMWSSFIVYKDIFASCFLNIRVCSQSVSFYLQIDFKR